MCFALPAGTIPGTDVFAKTVNKVTNQITFTYTQCIFNNVSKMDYKKQVSHTIKNVLKCYISNLFNININYSILGIKKAKH